MGFISPGWESQSWYTDWWNDDFKLRGELPVVAAVKAMPNLPVDGAKLAVVAGAVLRADNDAPLSGLTVVLLSGSKEVASTVSAGDGAFRFERLSPGVYDLSIPPWGVVRRGVAATQGPIQPVTIRLTGGGGSTLTGQVQSASGVPLSGIAVILSRDGVLVAETNTSADGSFRFGGLPMGAYRLAVPGITVAGLALDGWQSKNLKLTAGAPAGYRYAVVNQRLLPAEETVNRSVFFGVVNDANGTPLNGIRVQMAWHGAASDSEFPVTTTGHDPYRPAGSYEFLHTQGMLHTPGNARRLAQRRCRQSGDGAGSWSRGSAYHLRGGFSASIHGLPGTGGRYSPGRTGGPYRALDRSHRGAGDIAGGR